MVTTKLIDETPTCTINFATPQKLAAAALVWLMAATLKEREREGVDGSGMAVHVTPLLGLMGEGDAAAAAASSILVGLALERPALVIPEVGG